MTSKLSFVTLTGWQLMPNDKERVIAERTVIFKPRDGYEKDIQEFKDDYAKTGIVRVTVSERRAE